MAADQPHLPWNWKTAVWSGMYRAPAFFIAGYKSGIAAAVRGAGLEFLLFAAMAGFTGAATQRFRNLQPPWKARVVILCLIPVFLHSLEWLAHTLAGTKGRGRGVLISVGMTVVGVAFNWYAMRRGALLAGGEGASFFHDLKRMPGIIIGFLGWLCGRGR